MNYLDCLNDEEVMAQRELHMKQLNRLFEGPPKASQPFYLDACLGRSSVDLYLEPENWVEDCLRDLARQCEENLRRGRYCPLILMGKPYSVHFTDCIFGAEVFFSQSSGEWYNKPFQTPAGSLKKPVLEESEAWNLAKRIAKAFRDSGVKAPYFSMTTIASPLNVLLNLYGSDVLVDLLLEPEAVRRDLDVITQAQVDMHQWYAENIEEDQLQCTTAVIRMQPPGFSQLCGCSTQLISSDLYASMILPYDHRILKAHKYGGMIHLCGSHLQHLETFCNMEALRALQLNDQAADDLDGYVAGLRKDQVLYVRPTKRMTAERIREICSGRPVVITSDIQW